MPSAIAKWLFPTLGGLSNYDRVYGGDAPRHEVGGRRTPL